jgi:hypothetical protein
MALINVVKAFTIRLVRDGQEIERRVEAGVQEVEQYIADHWYAKAHMGDFPERVATLKEDKDAKAKADADAKVPAKTGK